MPSATRSLPACCATRWRRSRFSARTTARRPCARPSSELLSMDEPRKRFAAMMSGLDIHYDLGEGHPLLGRRMPDLDLVTADGPLRVFTLLHDARPVLLNLGEPGGFDITPWADRVQLIDAEYAGDVGASGPGPGRRPSCRADPTRWLRRLGGGRHRYRLARRADYLVRITMTPRPRWPAWASGQDDSIRPTESPKWPCGSEDLNLHEVPQTGGGGCRQVARSGYEVRGAQASTRPTSLQVEGLIGT